MPITTIGVAAAVTPSVIETYFSHYLNRGPLRNKPTAHISYHEGLRLIRQFLDYAAKHKVEDIQAFTGQWVPAPTWVRIDDCEISSKYLDHAAKLLQDQLGRRGLERIGGKTWWQWRRPESPLKAEWIEMKKDYNERKKAGQPCDRVLLYIHGGAYYFGSVDEHRYQMQRHARKLKARCLAPRYRLAPQFPFPCGLQDCIAAYLFLLELFPPEQILLSGDSAGGGMTVSLLVTLRDQGIPLPAGAMLLSPWVDLTHSFPSVAGDGKADYIPPHGFMHRPSIAWPPPPHEALEQIGHEPTAAASNGPATGGIPGMGLNLSIDLDGEHIEIKEQIQMYAPNELLSFPLVSPVMQPSLGGLPPLLIQVGGGELLHDEQVYLAHKAADPKAYPPSDGVLDEYDPKRELLNKYPPTDVQLQIWDDLCHVPHTLSFTRPAKYMYRSVAQFGAWALAHAQHKSVEIREDDVASLISEGGSDDENDEKAAEGETGPPRRISTSSQGAVGKAGDPLPPFHHHMIRQRVDRHGDFYPLNSKGNMECLHLDPNTIGVIKPGPVRKWLRAKRANDARYANAKRKVQQERAKELARGYDDIIGEVPPPTALVNRRRKGVAPEEKKRGRSWGLSIWTGWGSSHDGDALEREEQIEKDASAIGETGPDGEKVTEQVVEPIPANAPSTATSLRPNKSTRAPSSRRSGPRSTMSSRPMSPYRQVIDAGQVEDERDPFQSVMPIPASTLSRHTSTHAPIPVATQDPQVPTTAVIAPDSAPVPGAENTYLNPSNHRPHNGIAAYPFRLKNPNRNPSTLTLDSQIAESVAGKRSGTATPTPVELPAPGSNKLPIELPSQTNGSADESPVSVFRSHEHVFDNKSSQLGAIGPDGMVTTPVAFSSQPRSVPQEADSHAVTPVDGAQDGKLPFKVRNSPYDSRVENRPPSYVGPSPTASQSNLPFKLRHTVYDPQTTLLGSSSNLTTPVGAAPMPTATPTSKLPASNDAPPPPPPKDDVNFSPVAVVNKRRSVLDPQSPATGGLSFESDSQKGVRPGLETLNTAPEGEEVRPER